MTSLAWPAPRPFRPLVLLACCASLVLHWAVACWNPNAARIPNDVLVHGGLWLLALLDKLRW
jgi:hypothetical protein